MKKDNCRSFKTVEKDSLFKQEEAGKDDINKNENKSRTKSKASKTNQDHEKGKGSPLESEEQRSSFDKMILADGVVSTFDSSQTGLNNNLIVLGTTGSGKSMSVTEPQLMHTYNNSLVVTMTKRKLADKYGELLHSRGYQVDVLDLTNPEMSTVGFDPLGYILDEADILPLARMIVYTSKNKASNRDPYWDEAAISLVAAEIAALIELWVGANEEEQKKLPEPNLENLLELHQKLRFYESDRAGITVSTLDTMFERIAKQNPMSFAVQCWSAVKGLAYKTVSCIVSTVNVAYSQVFTPKIREVCQKKEADPFLLGSKRCVLFVITSPVEKSAHLFTNIVYATLFKVLFEFAEEQKDYRLPNPVHFICDDFACGCPIPDFGDYISFMRAAGISATLLLQSETQLEKMYGPEDATTIFNNCDRLVYLGGMDLRTCSNIAKRANVPFGDVIELPLKKAYVFERGKRAVFANRYPTMEDPLWEVVHYCGPNNKEVPSSRSHFDR